jgi:DNA-binding XRE family transcriptional regulator
MATRNEIGAMITANRDKQGLTIDEMAELISVQPYKLHSLEDGKDYLNKVNRLAIDALLGIELPPLYVHNGSNVSMYLGQELREARTFNNHNAQEASIAIGCCEGSIYTWESGKPCNSTTRKLAVKYIEDTENRLAQEGTPVAILDTTKARQKSQVTGKDNSSRKHMPASNVPPTFKTKPKEVRVTLDGQPKRLRNAVQHNTAKIQQPLPEKVAEPKSPEDIVHEALQAAHKERDLRDIVTIAVSIDQKKLKTIANYARSVHNGQFYNSGTDPIYYTEE